MSLSAGNILFGIGVRLADSSTSTTDTSETTDTASNFFQRMWESIVNFFIDDGPNVLLNVFISILLVILAHYLIKFINFLIGKSLSKAKVIRQKEAKLGKEKKIKIRRKPINYSVIYFIQSLVKFIVYCIVIFIIFGMFGVSLTSLGTILAGAIAGITLSLQDVISSFAYGVILITAQEFQVGDYITLTSGVQGTVRRLNLLSTVLVTTDGQVVYIPNNVIGKGSITNSSSEPTRYLMLNFNISYDSDLPKAQKILINLAKANTKVFQSPEPAFVITGFNDNSVGVSLRVYCNNSDYWDIVNKLYADSYRELTKAKVKIGTGSYTVRLAKDGEVKGQELARQ